MPTFAKKKKRKYSNCLIKDLRLIKTSKITYPKKPVFPNLCTKYFGGFFSTDNKHYSN